MKENKNSKLGQAVYEAVFPEALEDMPVSEHEFSEKFRKKMQKLITRRKSAFYPLVATAGRRAAVIILCTVVGLSALSVSAAAVFPEKFGVILEQIGSYLGIGFGNEPTIESVFGTVSSPSYVPDGYGTELIEQTDTQIYISYTDSDGNFFSYSQRPLTDTSLMVDARFSPTQTSVAGHDAVLFTGRGKILIWSDGIYLIRIEDYGDLLPLEELYKMAESVYSD